MGSERYRWPQLWRQHGRIMEDLALRGTGSWVLDEVSFSFSVFAKSLTLSLFNFDWEKKPRLKKKGD